MLPVFVSATLVICVIRAGEAIRTYLRRDSCNDLEVLKSITLFVEAMSAKLKGTVPPFFLFKKKRIRRTLLQSLLPGLGRSSARALA